MSNFIIALAVFVITIVGALFAVPYFIDWNGYRGVFEEEATRLLGREVRVGGAVNLHVLPVPYFRFEKVRIADTSVNLQEPFFRADSLAVKLNVAPLFRGAIEANEIEFQRPVLRLALNDEGGWNWQSFGAVLANADYLPTNVALASVKISSGVLAVHGRDGMERARFDGIDAELSAPALRGPYRLRGTLGSGEGTREIRIATAEPESDGTVRFKAAFGAPIAAGGTAASYTLEGRLLDPMGKPHLAGELGARLPIAGILRSAPGASAARSPGAPNSEPAFELRASLAAGPAGADLTDLALSFEQDGRPQLISGSLKAMWGDAVSVDMSLSSRWLDLDRIAGVADGAGPLASIIPLALRLRDVLPAETHSHARLSIDQANLGREAVSDLRLALGRSQDKLEVEELRLSMPGGSRGELKGIVSGPPGTPQFEGGISLRGTSIVRFFTWATGGALPFVAEGDGTFGIRSGLAIASGMAAARDIVGDLSGTVIGGAAQYRWEGRPEVSLLLEGPQLDARPFVPAGSTLSDIVNLAMYGTPAGRSGREPAAAGGAGWRVGEMDAFIRLNAGQLITANRTYRDVMAELELKGGRLKLPLLRISGDDGFNVELEGEVEDAASHPKGTVRGAVSVETPQGLAPVLELLGISTLPANDHRARAMVPLRIAGAMRLGRRTPTSADLSLAGEANGASLKINGRFDGSPTGWRAGPADVTALIEGVDAGVIAQMLLPGRPPARGGPVPGRLLVKANGIPAEGLAALASVDAGELALAFRGQLFAAANDTTASGDLEIKAADAARIAGLAGIAASLRLDGLPIDGSLKLSASRSSLRIDRLAVRIGGSEVRGKLLLSSLGERQRIEARFDLDELSLAQLIAPLLDQRLAVAGAAEAAISGRESPWPDEPFEARAFDAMEGNVYLTGKHLSLAEGVGLRDVSLDIALGASELDVRKIEGLGLGGRVHASVRCERVPGGVSVRGTVRLLDGRLEAIVADAGAKGSAAGGLTGDISFAGRGSSVRSLIAALEGSGALTLSEAKLARLWPGAVAIAADAALRAEPDKVGASLRQGLAAGLAAGRLPLPDTIGLDVGDGQLRMKPLVIDTPDGRASGSASLDLRTLSLQSDWRLEQIATGQSGEKAAPPAVGIGYRAPVISLGSQEPRIATEALEREIAVRRVERDVEELERLRKVDETRRRDDAERLRRQLEQSPPPVPVAPATPQGRAARPG